MTLLRVSEQLAEDGYPLRALRRPACDEFGLEFMSGVVWQSRPDKAREELYARTQRCQYLIHPQRSIDLPEGEYILRGEDLYCVWRLYPDISEAFHLPVISRPFKDE